MLTFKTLDWFELFQQCSFESSFFWSAFTFHVKAKNVFLSLHLFLRVPLLLLLSAGVFVCLSLSLFIVFGYLLSKSKPQLFFLSQPTSTKTFHPNEIACIQNVQYTPNTLSQIQLYSLVELLMLYKYMPNSVWCFTGLEYFQLTKTFSLM